MNSNESIYSFGNLKNFNAEAFEVALLDEKGARYILGSDDFKVKTVLPDKTVFRDPKTVEVDAVVKKKRIPGGYAYGIEISSGKEFIIETVKFPIIRINCNMKGDGGDTVIFWPSMEGALIEYRSNKYYSDGMKSRGGGYTGLTPGSSAMQFMAVYSKESGLYLGANDEDCNIKDFEYYFEDKNTVRLECTHFSGGSSEYKLPYDILLKEFKGDWQDAADIYRNWLEKSRVQLPQKLINRKDLPEWIYDSPIPVLYPVRGGTDKDCDGQMSSNCYYPYSNILPVVCKYAKRFDSRIMPLLMHWEGSAPWSNPYVWPPYGDVEDFKKTVDELHKKGHLIGLYASGIGYATKSVKDSSYENIEGYKSGGWEKCTCRTNRNRKMKVTALSFVREGYELCPYCEETKHVTVDEAVKIAKADIDYFQAFDQNLGGMPHFCWSREHGHGRVPGKWIVTSMQELFSDMEKEIKNAGKQMLFGCELAASEPMMKYLNFNDLRWFTVLRQGRPVPAYSYLYHEYTFNFMGNQNGLEEMIDFAATPDNLLYRTAYSFLAGDMLSIVLGSDGNINWGWNAPFCGDFPESEHLENFIRSANGWRKSAMKKYLCYGKLLKTKPANCDDSIAFVTKKGYNIVDRTVLNRKFRAPDGTVAEFFVNRTFTPQQVKFGADNSAKLYRSPDSYGDVPESLLLDAGEICCVVK